MIAYRLVPGHKEPQRETVPIPDPGPDEVLIKILAAGVCHSDVHLLEWAETRPFVPFAHTLGHEGAGIVVSQGENVVANPSIACRLAIGTYVAVLTTNACERAGCDQCRRGFQNVCFDPPMIGIGGDGCWAEYVVARASTVVPVPGNNPKDPRLSPAVVAVTTDAVMTPWHAMKRAAGIQPGQTVLILGCGGLGLNAIQVAKNVLGAGTVIASDVRKESLSLALQVGVDYAVAPGELKALLAEKGILIDVAVDLVGKQGTMDAAIGAVRTGATVLLVGLGADAVSISPLLATTKQLTIRGSFGGDYQDLEECLEAVAEGKVRPEVEEKSMEECGQVVQALARGGVRARVALIPQ
ncbi:alcohol dehydogenase [Trametes maxima]|nr:alcohol dehydogenase [Trametes maxima]